MEVKYNRILLKLSGEALMGQGDFGIDATTIKQFAETISSVAKLGVELGIVIGGGNIFRGIKSEDTGIAKITGDKMGMLATIMNALALADVLNKIELPAIVQTAVLMPQFADVFNVERAKFYLKQGNICIFAGGTGNPLFTTDSAAALRGVEIGADILIKATNVSGVYDSDPKRNPNAKMFSKITFDECIDKELKVMDRTAFVLCKENDLPIAVLNIHQKNNLLDFMFGKNIGTIIENK